MVAHSVAASAAFDPSARHFLPLSAAIRGPRFSPSSDWAPSATARESLDLLDLDAPCPPRRDHDASAESIVMSGAEIRNSVRVGGVMVTQQRTVAALEALELSIVMEATPTPVTPLQADAQQALNALAARKVPTRAVSIQEPSAGLGSVLMWTLVIGALVFTAHELLAVLK